jgi:hypothetical protein
MKSKLARLVVFGTFAAAALVTALPVSGAGIAERSPSPAASALADEGDCGDAGAFDTAKTVIPSLSVMVCDDCRFSETDRYNLLLSYGEAAQRAGLLVDPRHSRLFAITETGVLTNGAPYLKGTIGHEQLTVGDPFPGETLASVAGKLALVTVSGDQ